MRVGVALALPLLLAASGCGDSGSDAGPVGRSVPDLDGTSWIATGVTEQGQPRALVEGTQLRVEFKDGTITLNAGCNAIGGSYTLTDEAELRTGSLSGTEMGCEEPLMDQDRWISGTVFAAPLVASVAGNTLMLSRDDVELVLTDRALVAPNALLERTAWQLQGIRSGDSVSSVRAGTTTPTFTLAADGTVTLRTGCSAGHASATVSGSTITLGPVVTTKMSCADRAGRETEAAVLAVLDGAVEWSITEKTLKLSKGDRGLVYRAAS